MNQYRYILQPYGNGRNTRFACPNCGEKREFTRYVDTETGQYVHETVGSCNRQSKCGYHYSPRQFFTDYPWLQDGLQTAATSMQTKSNPAANALQPENQTLGNIMQQRSNSLATPGNILEKPISYVPLEKLRKSRRCYGKNNFVRFLISKVGAEKAEKLISLYHIGTSKRWAGATVFWQIDQHGKIRTGKIMLYNSVSGKRVKKPKDHIDWAHKYLEQENYNLSQCLFGEHLLRQFPDKPVAVVESEKTATVCTAYLPEYVWLATGSKGNLSRDRCLVLRGRSVTLFPDLGGYEKWSEQAEAMADIASFTVSDILERIATEEEMEEGLDLADFL